MNHIIFFFLFVAFMSLGAWTISTVLLYGNSRKRLLILESIVGLSLMIITGGLLVKYYGRNCGLDLHTLSTCIVIAGMFACLVSLPFFTHAIAGRRLSRLMQGIFTGIAVTLSFVLLFMPKIGRWDITGPFAVRFPEGLSEVALIVYVLFFYGTLGYCFVVGMTAGKSIGDRILKKMYSATFGTCMIFVVPLVIFIIIGAESAAVICLSCMFISLSIEILYFSIFFSNQPLYLKNGGLTSNFVTRFLISDREQQIIILLLEGKANKEIADGLSISPRTVENHLSSIYQKTSVTGRVQLINLIRANATA